MDAIPIPTQVRTNAVKGHRTRYHSATEYSSSEDSSTANSPNDDVCPLSRSFHSSSHFNVYGSSPRTTSVMFNYYNSPQSFNKTPLSRARSSDIGNSSEPLKFVRSSGISSSNASSQNSVTSPNKLKFLNGAGGANMSHLSPDNRPRAWSESDKNRSNTSLQTSRMNALKKLKMKLGRSNNQRKMKSDQDEMNKSAASITSLEKVEEGRQMNPMYASNRLSADMSELSSNVASMTLQNETSHVTENVSRNSIPLSTAEEVAPNIYHRFLSEHSCYDLMPRSSKLVILDTRLEVSKAFDALVANNLRSAPLWDEQASQYVGMLTVSDFLKILLAYHKNPKRKTSELESQQISCWRRVLQASKNLIHVCPENSLLEALNVLMDQKIRRLPVKNPHNGDIYHVVNYRRILHFLHLFMSELPKPDYMDQSLKDLNIGTFGNIASITQDEEVVRALELIEEHRVSGLPVVDEKGVVQDLFTKTDVLMLAGENLFHDLSIKVRDVLKLTKNDHFTAEPGQDNNNDVHRKIPGSPALPRRNKKAAERKTSKETKHPFLKSHDASPLIKGISGTPVTKQHASAHIKGHPVVAKQKSKESLMAPVVSPDRPVKRHRHASSQSCKGSMSTHLVLVDIHDTLGNVVDSLVFNDALQAVIVNHSGQAEGIVSIGDVLRFMTTETNQPSTPPSPDLLEEDEEKTLENAEEAAEPQNNIPPEENLNLAKGDRITRQ